MAAGGLRDAAVVVGHPLGDQRAVGRVGLRVELTQPLPEAGAGTRAGLARDGGAAAADGDLTAAGDHRGGVGVLAAALADAVAGGAVDAAALDAAAEARRTAQRLD